MTEIKYECKKCGNVIVLMVKGKAQCTRCNRPMKPVKAAGD